MNGAHDDAMAEMVSLYAVGAIDARTGECAAVRAHLADCATCRAEFQRAAAASAALGLSAAQTPPPGLLEKILKGLPRESEVILFESRPQRRWFVPAAVAAAVVIAAGIYWGLAPHSQSWTVACVPSVAGCHAGGVLASRSGMLTLRLHGLAALPAGRQYQAWMIHPGAQPQAEPVFSPTADGDGSVSFAETAEKGAIVAVTVEPEGGSRMPTSAPFLVAKIE